MFLATCLLALLFSCSTKKEQEELIIQSLTHEVLMGDEYLIGKINDMALMNDSIPVVINVGSDKMFQVLDHSRKKVLEVGNVGQGPDDFLLSFGLLPSAENAFSVSDVNRCRFSTVHLNPEDDSWRVEHHFKYDSVMHLYIKPIVNNRDVATGIYEDNHLMVVNKHAGELVQSDPDGTEAIEDQIKAMIKIRDHKPGAVFLGVVHRIDRPVSGAVVFAKTSKALARLNEMIRNKQIKKTYWAITEERPAEEEGSLRHFIARNAKTNRSHAYQKPKGDAKEALLDYRVLGASTNYTLVEVDLKTGRHHQIRAQLSAIGCSIKGDLKYGAKRSNKDGGISLHSRRVEFLHPVGGKPIAVTAPTPKGDGLWDFFECAQSEN